MELSRAMAHLRETRVHIHNAWTGTWDEELPSTPVRPTRVYRTWKCQDTVLICSNILSHNRLITAS